MSAVSVLKNKSLPALDTSPNEFAALEGLNHDVRPAKSKYQKNDIETELLLTEADRENFGPARWIRDNIKVAPAQKGPRVTWTPWKNGSELAMVRDWFFPEHAAKDPYAAPIVDFRKEAVHAVYQWEAQNRDLELPHSVIATASLTDAALHDTKPSEQRLSYISDQALQSIYAMAFCRFVNGFVDRDVAKSSLTAMATTTVTHEDGLTTIQSRGEGSMYALAGKIGMPIRFVDMRHQITHERMPAIEDLARLTGEALEWMYERWWKRNAAFDPTEAWDNWRGTEEHN